LKDAAAQKVIGEDGNSEAVLGALHMLFEDGPVTGSPTPASADGASGIGKGKI
jgi:hypothetical protein